jgi:uncharacterized protein YhfF
LRRTRAARAQASDILGPYRLSAGGEPLPEPGKLVILTDWSGEAKALIETKAVAVRRFGDVSAGFAALEGEGDGSLAGWRAAHRAFWMRRGETVDDDFMVVCEAFEVLLISGTEKRYTRGLPLALP